MGLTLDLIVTSIALITGVSAAIGIVVVRRSFYAIIWLAFVGISTAMVMAILGFTYLAIFHLLIYVGATIAFLTLVMTAIGESERIEPRHSLIAAILSALVAIAVIIPVELYVSSTTRVYSLAQIFPGFSELGLWTEVSRKVFVEFWPATLFALIALVAMLIEVIAVARKS